MRDARSRESSDRRRTLTGRSLCLQIGREEVALRSLVGVKKDEYSLDEKHVTYAAAPAPFRGRSGMIA